MSTLAQPDFGFDNGGFTNASDFLDRDLAVKKKEKKGFLRRVSHIASKALRRQSRRESTASRRESTASRRQSLHQGSMKVKKSRSRRSIMPGSKDNLLDGIDIANPSGRAFGDISNRGSTKRVAQDGAGHGHFDTPAKKTKKTFDTLRTPKRKAESFMGKIAEYHQSPQGGASRQNRSVQKTFSSLAHPNLLGRLSRREVCRQEAILEFQSCEFNYKEKLNFQFNTYQHVLEKDAELGPGRWKFGVDKVIVDRIFGEKCDRIREAHNGKSRCLHDQLMRTRSAGEDGKMGMLTNIGSIVNAWIDEGNMSPYVDYCCNIMAAKQVLRNEVEKQNALQHQMLNMLIAIGKTLKEGKRQTLADLLDLPRRHIQRYPLLLSEILKYTPETDPDYRPLKAAIAAAKNFCHQVDSRMKETEGARVVAIANRIDTAHSSKHQPPPDILQWKFVSETRTGLNMKDGKPLYMYLFEEALLIMKDSKYEPGKELMVGEPIFLQHAKVSVSDDPTSARPAQLHIQNENPQLIKQHSTRKGFSRGGGSGSFGKGKSFNVSFVEDADRTTVAHVIESLRDDACASTTGTMSFA